MGDRGYLAFDEPNPKQSKHDPARSPSPRDPPRRLEGSKGKAMREASEQRSMQAFEPDL